MVWVNRFIYDQLKAVNKLQVPCRIYAPVGSHKELLGYLVRRLLENGANTSFINHLANDQIPLEKMIADPFSKIDRAARYLIPAFHYRRIFMAKLD